MAYRPGRARLAAGRRRRFLPRHLRRIDPNVVYYLVFGGAAALIGVALDAVSSVPWWVVLGLGLAGAWAFTWMTALDDVRHPWRSLKILAATVRDSAAATRVRAVVYELPLYAPPPEWPGTRRLSGGGLSFGRKVLSPARPSATVGWSNDQAELRARTETRPTGTGWSGGLPPGISHHLALLEEDPGLDGMTVGALVDELRPVTFAVEGRPLSGTILDLSSQGLGWMAEARVDDQFVVALAATGVEPGGLTLVRLDADDLIEPVDAADD